MKTQNFLIIILILFVEVNILDAQISFSSKKTIFTVTGNNYTSSLYASDIDNDDDIDILSVFKDYDAILLHDNNNNSFTTQDISNMQYLSSINALDIDKDGDIDLLTSSDLDKGITWYENDGENNFTKHTIISNNSASYVSVKACDIDNDNDIDVIASTIDGNKKISLFENNGSQTFTEHELMPDISGIPSIKIVDMDDDNDLDILFCFGGTYPTYAKRVSWLKNNGDLNFTEQIITTTVDGARDVFAIDLDKDNDIDVLATSAYSNTMYWYENDGNQNFNDSIIAYNITGANRIFAIDLDNDDDVDIITSGLNQKVTWLENDGNQIFTKHVIETSAISSDIFAIDLDNDNDIDILAASDDDNSVAWFENQLYVGIDKPNEISSYSLNQNYPNPFNPTTEISFSIENKAHTKLTIMNTKGEIVETLNNSKLDKGSHSFIFNAKDLSSGIYFYQIKVNNIISTKKMILMR